MISEQPECEITLTQQQLCNQFFDYYLKLRSNQLPSLSQNIPSQFINIQKQIINMVELRKDMERTLEMHLLQSQHFTTVATLVDRNLNLESSIDQMAHRIKDTSDSNMNEYVESLKAQQKKQKLQQSDIIEKGQRLVLQLADFKRTFHVQASNIASTTDSQFEDSLLSNNHQDNQHFSQLVQLQQGRWQLARFIYSAKLKEIALREELLQERQRAHQDLQRSNNQLIDTLLRQKQRDKNLRKKDNQKFEEIIKQRDEIDFQNQNLSHSEKSLLPHLQSELLKIKNKLKQQQSRYESELQRLRIKNAELIQKINKITEKNATLSRRDEKQLEQMKTFLEKSERSRQQVQEHLRLSQQQQKQLSSQLQKVRKQMNKQVRQLEAQKSQLQDQMEKLQSKHNQLILKSSQFSHYKAELTQKNLQTISNLNECMQKLNESQKRLQIAENQLQEYEQNKQNLQNSAKNAHSEKELIVNFLQEQLNQKTKEIRQLNIENKQLNEEISNFQNEKSIALQKFQIEETKLLNQLHYYEQVIQQLRLEVQRLKEEKTSANENAQDYEDLYRSIRQEVVEELQRSSKIKLNMIDEFVDRMNQFIA